MAKVNLINYGIFGNTNDNKQAGSRVYNPQSGKFEFVKDKKLDLINKIFMGEIVHSANYNQLIVWKDAIKAEVTKPQFTNSFSVGNIAVFINKVLCELKGLKAVTESHKNDAIAEVAKSINTWTTMSLDGLHPWYESTEEVLRSLSVEDLAIICWSNPLIFIQFNYWNEGYDYSSMTFETVYEANSVEFQEPVWALTDKNYDRKKEATDIILDMIDNLSKDDMSKLLWMLSDYKAAYESQKDHSIKMDENVRQLEVWEMPWHVSENSNRVTRIFDPVKEAYRIAKELVEILHFDFDLDDEEMAISALSSNPNFKWLQKDQLLHRALVIDGIDSYDKLIEKLNEYRNDEDYGDVADYFANQIRMITQSKIRVDGQPDDESDALRFLVAKYTNKDPHYYISSNLEKFRGSVILANIALMGNDVDVDEDLGI